MINKKELHTKQDYKLLANTIGNRLFLVKILVKRKSQTACPICRKVNFKHNKKCDMKMMLQGIRVNHRSSDSLNPDVQYIKKLAEKFIELQKSKEEKERELEFLNEDLRLLSEETIPEAMINLQTDEIAIDEDHMLVVTPHVYGSIPPEKEEKCFAWMEKHDGGPLIKSTFKIEFDRLAEKSTERFRAMLLKTKYIAKDGAFTEKRGVLSQTLNKFLRECIAEGISIPRSKFNVSEVDRAKIKKKTKAQRS